MKKFVVIPYDRYKSELAGAACRKKRCKTKTTAQSKDVRVEITRPTSVPAYTRALNQVSDNRPIMVTQQGSGRHPPRPPSKDVIATTLRSDYKPPQAVKSGRVKHRNKPKRLINGDKTGWLKF